MEFSRRKLPKEAIENLYAVPVSQIRAFSIMLGPVYLYFKENEKFVAIKSPLDFFTDEELNHFLPFEYFYFHRAMLHALPFREAGKNIRTLLTWQKPILSYRDVLLSPSPFELSSLTLKMVGPLWWNYPYFGTAVEPFLVIGFMSELCDRFSAEKLSSIRDKQIYRSDSALIRCSMLVFLAIHLGYCNLNFLNQIRDDMFDRILKGQYFSDQNSEIEELIKLIHVCLDSHREKVLPSSFFRMCPERAAQKLVFRLLKVEREFLNRGRNPPSIFGERGFLNEP